MRKSAKLLLRLIISAFTIIICVGIGSYSIARDAVKINKSDIKNKLMFLRNDDIWAYNFENKTEKRLTYYGDIRNYAISADATKLAYVRALKKLLVYDTESGVEDLIAELVTDASQPSFSPSADKIALIGLTKEPVEFRFSYFQKPVMQRVRHILIVDVKTKNVEDVTRDIPFQHSQVCWSPNGRWLSFASYRFGILDKLNPFSSKSWSVYLMDLSDSSHKTIEISGGMNSAWLNKDQIIVLEGIYNVGTKTITDKPAATYPAGLSPLFYGGVNNEVVYYEVTPADPDENALIRSRNLQTNQTEDVVKNVNAPQYVK